MSAAFERLAVYGKCAQLSDEVWEFVRGWNTFDRWTLGIQLVRAVDSVSANIAEATGRWSYPDRRRILFLARGSAYELEHWLIRAEARTLTLPDDLSSVVCGLGSVD